MHDFEGVSEAEASRGEGKAGVDSNGASAGASVRGSSAKEAKRSAGDYEDYKDDDFAGGDLPL